MHFNFIPNLDFETSQVVGRLDHHIALKHDDVIKWKHFPHYWSFVRGIHWSPVNPPPTHTKASDSEL